MLSDYCHPPCINLITCEHCFHKHHTLQFATSTEKLTSNLFMYASLATQLGINVRLLARG